MVHAWSPHCLLGRAATWFCIIDHVSQTTTVSHLIQSSVSSKVVVLPNSLCVLNLRQRGSPRIQSVAAFCPFLCPICLISPGCRSSGRSLWPASKSSLLAFPQQYFSDARLHVPPGHLSILHAHCSLAQHRLIICMRAAARLAYPPNLHPTPVCQSLSTQFHRRLLAQVRAHPAEKSRRQGL